MRLHAREKGFIDANCMMAGTQQRAATSGEKGLPRAAFLPPSPLTQRPALILLGVTCGTMLAFLDATMVNIALPSLQATWQADLSTMSWSLNAYNLVFALLLIPAGRLADHFGHKRLFLNGLLLFGAGSAFCALSPALLCFIAARALQGAGGAVLNTVGLAKLLATFPAGNARKRALSIWGAANGGAIALGPLLSGLCVQWLDWRWMFLLTVPLCAISFGLIWHFAPETRGDAVQHVDLIGLLLLCVTLVLLIFFALQGTTWGWFSTWEVVLGEGALVGGLAFVLLELRQKHPLVQVRLFVGRSFALGSLAMLLFAIALMGAFVIFVLYLRDEGMTPLHAALLLLPTPVSSFVLSLLAGQMGDRLCPRWAALAGLMLLAAGLFSLTTLPSPLLFGAVLWRGMMIGAGMGLCFFSLPSLALREIPLKEAGQASGAFGLAQQIGFTLGVAVLSAVLEQQPHSLHDAFTLTWEVAGGCAAAGGMVVSLLPGTGTRNITPPRLASRRSLSSSMRGHVVQTLEREAWQSHRDTGKPERALRWSRSQLILRKRYLLIEKGKRHHVVFRKRRTREDASNP